MGVRILNGDGNGDSTGTVLYCSTTGWAFGPVMQSQEEAEAFLKFCPGDLRTYSDKELESLYCDFVHDWVCECGTVRDDEEPGPDEYQDDTLRFTCSYCQKKATDHTEYLRAKASGEDV